MDTLGIPGLRDPTDFAAVRQDIYDAVLDGVRTKYPLENATHRLELVDTEYDGPEIVPYKAQKQAILQRKSLYRPIKGTWRLVDKATGDVLDQKRTTIARVPMLTQRGTYTINGSDTSVAHQMRLRPGVYVRRKANGDPEAHFNIMKGGPSFRLLLEPKTGVFRKPGPGFGSCVSCFEGIRGFRRRHSGNPWRQAMAGQRGQAGIRRTY